VQHCSHENRFGLIQCVQKLILRRKSAAQALSLGADCDARLPKRPRIENKLVEDKVFALALAKTEFVRAIFSGDAWPPYAGSWRSEAASRACKPCC
jgi:hypothetical protein